MGILKGFWELVSSLFVRIRENSFSIKFEWADLGDLLVPNGDSPVCKTNLHGLELRGCLTGTRTKKVP